MLTYNFSADTYTLHLRICYNFIHFSLSAFGPEQIITSF